MVGRELPLHAPLWIDEGLSTGIASHPVGEIPGLLRMDGAPPLYYLVLHAWMAVFGTSEAATHSLSLTAAVLAVPAAWWAARPFGATGGLLAAALAATSPFVGLYADETRMYTLVFLLGLLATGTFVRAFVVDGRRRYAIMLGLALAAVMYTHAWGAFLALAMGLCWLALVALGPDRRALAVNGAIAFGGAAILFAPWLPTLDYQAAHTGAPWSHRPTGRSLETAVTRMLSGRIPEAILLITGLGLLAEGLRTGGGRFRRAAPAIVAIAALTLLFAWAWSRMQDPAWALRYLVIVLAPLVVALAIGLGRAPVLGVAAVAVVVALHWSGAPSPRALEHKSNVASVARRVAAHVGPGTLVLSIQPEQVTNLAYYLPRGRRMEYMTPLGAVRDPGVMDWRDAMARLRRARYGPVVGRAVADLRPGRHVLLVAPKFRRVDAPWTALIKRLTRRWTRHLRHSRYLRLVTTIRAHRMYSRSTVQALVFRRQ